MPKEDRKISQEQGNILGIVINSNSKNRVLNEVASKFPKKEKFYIVTPNPEIILASRKDKHLRDILNNAGISINDGIGVAIADYYLRLPTSKIFILRLIQSILYFPFTLIILVFRVDSVVKHAPVIKGREFFSDLILLSSRRRYRVYLLGSKADVSENLAKILKNKYRKLSIKASSGPILDKNAKPLVDQDQIYGTTLADIRKFAPHVVFVGFGAPKQEKFIAANLEKLPVKAMMAVGGTFDYEVAPSKMIRMFAVVHLEWLGRLIRQPKRLIRVFRAVIVFPLLIFLQKVRGSG